MLNCCDSFSLHWPIKNTESSSHFSGTSQRGSPGIRSPGIGPNGPKMHPATTRSFSLHEASFMRLGGGSLTSGQPINRQQQQQQLTCNFCQLKFPNEAGLEAHESRCSKKEMLLQKQQSQPQLKFTPTQQQQQQQQQQLQLQLQQLQEHQSTIAALVGGGKGVARDLMINGNGGNAGGRASVNSANLICIESFRCPRLVLLVLARQLCECWHNSKSNWAKAVRIHG